VSNSSSLTSKQEVFHENDSCEVATLALPAYKKRLEIPLPSYCCPNEPFAGTSGSLPRSKESAQLTKEISPEITGNPFLGVPKIQSQPHKEQRLLTNHFVLFKVSAPTNRESTAHWNRWPCWFLTQDTSCGTWPVKWLVYKLRLSRCFRFDSSIGTAPGRKKITELYFWPQPTCTKMHKQCWISQVLGIRYI